ncbi:hypothetical protein LX16_1836 [Stackebrandtia albiflava]|uniref:Glycine zipper family protein n=1 Tax=Stackebrandtia albiflava TaxID=406432 RepID=A0A562VE21_9ACTN|nr:hypothetical protein LX16_1836 [Stackebrandtia albiflava]
MTGVAAGWQHGGVSDAPDTPNDDGESQGGGNPRLATGISMGLSLGLGLGIVFGVTLLDDLALGMALGMAMGVGIGAALGSVKPSAGADERTEESP